MAIEEVLDWDVVARSNAAVHPRGPRGEAPARTSLSFQEMQAAIARWRNNFVAGDPGTEGTGITVNGTTYESVFKASDIGGTNAAQVIMHRHSTTLPAVIVGSRSKSDTDIHTAVADNDVLMTLLAVGNDGTDYAISSEIRFEVDGVTGNNDMPGQITFMTAPDGTQVPLERMRIRATGNIEIDNDLAVRGNLFEFGNATVNAAVIERNRTDSLIAITAGTALNESAQLILWGSTHSAQAYDIVFKRGGGVAMQWDDSLGSWIFSTGKTGTLTTVLTLDDADLATFEGAVTVNGEFTSVGTIVAPAATTVLPSVNIPHGTPPTSPTNGDMWTTTAGLFVQVNGSTVGPLT